MQFIGTGENRWPFVHVDDLAGFYVLALKAAAGSLYLRPTARPFRCGSSPSGRLAGRPRAVPSWRN